MSYDALKISGTFRPPAIFAKLFGHGRRVRLALDHARPRNQEQRRPAPNEMLPIEKLTGGWPLGSHELVYVLLIDLKRMRLRFPFQFSILPQVRSCFGENIALRLGSASGWRNVVLTISRMQYAYQRSPFHRLARNCHARTTVLDALSVLLLSSVRPGGSHLRFPQAVIESADITAITQLILRERESRDLALWERMRTCFWPDSLVRVSWFRGTGPDFVTGSIDMFRRGVPAKHRLGPILVTLIGTRAVATLSGIIDLPVNIHGVAGTLSTHARLLYRAEKRSRPLGAFRLRRHLHARRADPVDPRPGHHHRSE